MNWALFNRCYKAGISVPGLTFEALSSYDTVYSPLYKVHEETSDYKFTMLRLQASKRKITIDDDLGCVGFSSLDLSENHCYLTEGVSDFIAYKLMLQSGVLDATKLNKEGIPLKRRNVLGMTTLAGNKIANELLLSLFDNYTIIRDNDQTGITNAINFRHRLMQEGKQVLILTPQSGCKDISEEFVKTYFLYYPQLLK